METPRNIYAIINILVFPQILNCYVVFFQVRAVSARALGALVKELGEDNCSDLLPWLMETLISESSSVDRSGAAQGKLILYELSNHFVEHFQFCGNKRTLY